MSLSDHVLNAITGSNIKTIKVTVSQLASIINESFILKTNERSQRDEIEKTVKGKWMFPSELISVDGKFQLYVSHFESGLTTHRTAWVKNLETEEIYEWSGYSLGALKREVSSYLIAASLH